MIDNFLQMIQHVMPLCLSISFVYSVAMLTQTIVYEKELRLKEVMKIMGLNNAVHVLAWFITYFVQFTLIMAIVTCILHYGKILTHSNPALVFLILEVYAVSTICFSFLVSSLYSKVKQIANQSQDFKSFSMVEGLFFARKKYNWVLLTIHELNIKILSFSISQNFAKSLEIVIRKNILL